MKMEELRKLSTEELNNKINVIVYYWTKIEK